MKKFKTAIYLILFTTGFCLPSATKVVAEIPEPECVSTYGSTGETVCGYNCEKSGDGEHIACAEWPDGICKDAFSSVACGPPAPDNWHEKYETSSSSDRDRDRDSDCDCDK